MCCSSMLLIVLFYQFYCLLRHDNERPIHCCAAVWCCLTVLFLLALAWCFIKSVNDADKKNRAKKHELRSKNPEHQRNGEIKGPHAHGKMVCPHVEVFFGHAADLRGVFMPCFCAQHKGNVRVEPQ